MRNKILFFIQLPPPYYGVTNVNEIVFNSNIINKNVDKLLVRIDYSKEIKDLNKFNLNKIYKTLVIAFKLIKLFITKKIDYVYFTIVPTGKAFYRDLLFVCIIKIFRIVPIYHIHGKGIYDKCICSKLDRKLYQFVFNNSIVIHLSEKLLCMDFKNINTKKTKFFIVENGIPFKINHFIKRQPKNCIKLLFVSIVSASKGIFVLLKAIKELKEIFKQEIILDIVGGYTEEVFKASIDYIKNENLNNIVFHGAKTKNEVDKFYEEADIFVHPTLNDAFPLVILEAMQFGLPVISTTQGAIPDIVDDNVTGFIVESGNYIELAQKIQLLANNYELRIRMGKKGYDKFLKNYTIDIFENKMQNVFSELIK